MQASKQDGEMKSLIDRRPTERWSPLSYRVEGAGPAKALAQAATAAAAAAVPAVPVTVPPKRGLEAVRRRKGVGLGPDSGWFKGCEALPRISCAGLQQILVHGDMFRF